MFGWNWPWLVARYVGLREATTVVFCASRPTIVLPNSRIIIGRLRYMLAALSEDLDLARGVNVSIATGQEGGPLSTWRQGAAR